MAELRPKGSAGWKGKAIPFHLNLASLFGGLVYLIIHCYSDFS